MVSYPFSPPVRIYDVNWALRFPRPTRKLWKSWTRKSYRHRSSPVIMDVDDAVIAHERQYKAESFCGSSDLLIHSAATERFPLQAHSPFPNSNAPPNESVSIYLDYAGPKSAAEGWHACAQFALVVSNVHDPGTYVISCGCCDAPHYLPVGY